MESKDNKNAILAVVISGIILFGWNYFFAPQPYTNPNIVSDSQNSNTLNNQNINQQINSSNNTSDKVENGNHTIADEKVVTFKVGNETNWVDLNNKLEISDFKTSFAEMSSVNNFKKHNTKLTILKNDKKFTPIFSFKKIDQNNYSISDSVNGLNGTVAITDLGSIKIDIHSSDFFVPTLELHSEEIINEDDERKSNKFVYFHDGLEELQVGKSESDFFESKIKWIGLDHNYHLLGYVVDASKLYKIDYGQKLMRLSSLKPTNTYSLEVFYAKKNYDDLSSFGNDLNKAVDFGMWAIIAVPILRGLQYFYELFSNYGLAIIVLTILMRLLTFPLQYKSFKSMKKMQVIQPELQKIKEKHKENPQKMQQETMALFKKAGANPLSGCLPMLAQMPIFFAFYQVLFTSVELVGAPFYFWISDLSLKDPFYILPVLMGVAMFLNMKLTPTSTADPAQQKMMMFMPIIFSVFMLNLPAGLTLYMLVSTVVGMLQQLFVYKRPA